MFVQNDNLGQCFCFASYGGLKFLDNMTEVGFSTRKCTCTKFYSVGRSNKIMDVN